MKTDCIILAAGQGTRMKSSRPKVLHNIAGKALAAWVVDAAKEVTGTPPVLVVGNDAQKVKEAFGDSVRYAVQAEQLGTGHAVVSAEEYLTGDGYVIVVAGDMPLIRAETLKKIAAKAAAEKLGACLLSAVVSDPFGYGRIVRSGGGVACIVEHKDATDEELEICEVNASVYCFSVPLLKEALKKLKNDNAQGEYYLTDCVAYIAGCGHRIEAVLCEDPAECIGVNDRVQLAAAAKQLRQRINSALMREGVAIIDPDNTYIDAGVKIGMDTVVYPGVVLEGDTSIGDNSVLYPGSRIKDSRIGSGTAVQNSVILESTVGDSTTIGPYAYLRPNSVVGSGCRVGDFVEVKNALIKDGAKVSHLSYIGDGEIGERSNIGCGVVFVNYDGQKKSRTVVGKNVFVGCNANLIAPVTIDDGAYIAAGSTVTHDVERDALCIARSRQKNIEGWAKRRRGE
ncbi:MAG: bifunctional UDP-N-acetylglucosamine diphosphorylase/glucosamine-1-phosphate N-acetyltransferase GlmU [Eubacteriales bacterium]|nr:bifunctional UDP-N-acetylglucosamine diphosphorylase/glucosamine-1-phosphate N-acetyltransferase GlmU [Eubacteriales bacterium]